MSYVRSSGVYRRITFDIKLRFMQASQSSSIHAKRQYYTSHYRACVLLKLDLPEDIT